MSTMRLVEAAEARLSKADKPLSALAAHALYRVMAYKDEYEVARLHTEGLGESLRAQFARAAKISVWLSPPLVSAPDPSTGRPRKMRFGPWVFGLFHVLRSLKWLRGRAYDPFGWSAERREERRLRDDVIALLEKFSNEATADTYVAAMDALGLVSEVRGYGPVKMAAMRRYWEQRARVGHYQAHARGVAKMAATAK